MSTSSFEYRILQEIENPPLGRREITFEITHDRASTPKRNEIRERLAGKLNVNPDLVYVLQMETKTNSWRTIGTAHVYASPQRAKRLVPKFLTNRSLPKEDRAKLKQTKKAEKPAEKKPEKKPAPPPAAEKKEEKKPEKTGKQ